MGKKTKSEEKLSLIEFLYKDTEFVSSLYSQFFGGDLTGVQQVSATSEESTIDAGVDIKLAKSSAITKDSINEQLLKNIISKDDKIIDLFNELNIKEYVKSLNNCRNARIIKLEGDIYFRNLDSFKSIIPLMPSLNLLPDEFKEDEIGEEGTQSFLHFFEGAIPSGLEFELLTKQQERVLCNINETCLVSSSNNIAKNYSGKYLGNWTIIGVFDNTTQKKINLQNNDDLARSSIDEFEETMLSSLFGENQTRFIIKPIIIYRQLTY